MQNFLGMQVVSAQGPVFLHDAAGISHAASDQLVDQSLEVSSGLDGGGVEVLAGDVLDSVSVVDDTTSLDTDGEAVDLAINGDSLRGLLNPLLAAQVQSVLSAQGVDVFGVNHGDDVGIVCSVLGSHVSCDGGLKPPASSYWSYFYSSFKTFPSILYH